MPSPRMRWLRHAKAWRPRRFRVQSRRHCAGAAGTPRRLPGLCGPNLLPLRRLLLLLPNVLLLLLLLPKAGG
jgi:hypothetical protein